MTDSILSRKAGLQNRAGEAVDLLAEVIDDITDARSARASVAKSIIEYSIKSEFGHGHMEPLGEFFRLLDIGKQTSITTHAR